MTTPGRRTPCSPAPRLTCAVQWAGRLLCWSLAAGMATAAADLLLAPRAGWWPALWPLPWYLTCVSALGWAVLRAREKAAYRADREVQDDGARGEWDRAA